MNVWLLVALIVLGVVVVQAAIWIPIIIWIRAKSARALAEMEAEVAALEDERVVAGPEKGSYRGSSGRHGKVKGNGLILLTDRRLLFHKLVGATVDIPVHTITGTKRSKSFRGARTGGATHLVVTTNEPAEVAFYVNDLDTWQRHIEFVRTTPRP